MAKETEKVILNPEIVLRSNDRMWQLLQGGEIKRVIQGISKLRKLDPSGVT